MSLITASNYHDTIVIADLDYGSCTIAQFYIISQMLAGTYVATTVEPQLSGPHLFGFSVNQTMELTALLE